MIPTLTLISITLTFIGFGLYPLRHIKLYKLEKSCLAAALSVGITFYVAFVIYYLNIPDWWTLILPAVCFILSWLYLKKLNFKNISFEYKKFILILAVVFIYQLCLLSFTKNFCGGGWYGDWLEHYQRTLFFSKHLPLDTKFLDFYILPARPPLIHLVLSTFLKFNHEFYFYQALTLLFSCLFILAALLFVNDQSKSHKENLSAFYVFIALFLVTPSLIQSQIYGWPRPLTYFFVLLGIQQYLKYLNKQSHHIYAAASCFSFATLTHYSGAPYLLIFLIHFFIKTLVDKSLKQIGTFFKCCLCSFGLISPWILWSVKNYGISHTFLANSSAMEANRLSFSENLAKIGLNIRDSIVPHFFRKVSWNFGHSSTLEFWDNYFFLIYQPNLIFAFGSLSFIVITTILYSEFRNNWTKINVTFWVPLIIFSIFLSIAAVGGRDHFGLTHVGLHPLIALGLALIAKNFGRLSTFQKRILLTGLIIDFTIGTVLHFYQQNTFVHNYNFTLKKNNQLRFFGDIYNPFLLVVLLAALLLVLKRYFSFYKRN